VVLPGCLPRQSRLQSGTVDDWFALTERQLPAGKLYLKPGLHGFPDLPPGAASLQKLDLGEAGRVLDASGTAGLAALLTAGAGDTDRAVVDHSAAALRCISLTHAHLSTEVQAGFLWEAEPGSADTVISQPPADRGTARVELEISAAARLLEGTDGRLLLLGHRDRGAKRYEKYAAALFRETQVLRRDKGLRVLECRSADPRGRDRPEPETEFEAAGFSLTAIKGTYAAGKLDPGTAQLLAALGPAPDLAGREVLDAGSGYGLLALVAARAGAHVTAVDDDLAAVRSTGRNAGAAGFSDRIAAVHSDIDAALPEGQTFDTVLMNPPFHVGKGVRLDLPRAFIRRARERLEPGGELWLVANRSLPYERLLGVFRDWTSVRDEGGFKVLRAVR